MHKYCTNCGSKLQDNVVFCTTCGKKIKTANPVNSEINPIQSNQPQKTEKARNPIVTKKKLFIKIISVLVIFLIIITGIGFFVDNKLQNNTSTVSASDGVSTMDKATGFDFYSTQTIPCIETNHEFNEIYIPYIMRGLAIKYKEAQQFNEIIWSVDYMESVSFEEWQTTMGIASEKWAEVETYTEEFTQLLNRVDLTDSQRSTSIQFFTKAYAQEKINKEEAIELLKLADENKIDPIKMLTANMNISAEKAKKFAKIYWNKDTSQKINAEEEFKADVNDFAVKGLKTVEVLCKGTTVVYASTTLATVGMIKGAAILVANTDTVLSMGEDAAYYLFDNEEVGAAITKIRERSTKHIAPYLSFITLDPKNLKNSANSIEELFNTAMVSSGALIDLADKGVFEIDLTTSTGKANLFESSEDLEKALKDKGITVSDLTLSTEEYEKMKQDHSWIEADESKREEFEQMRDIEKMQDTISEEDYEQVMDWFKEIEALYDEYIKDTDQETASENDVNQTDDTNQNINSNVHKDNNKNKDENTSYQEYFDMDTFMYYKPIYIAMNGSFWDVDEVGFQNAVNQANNLMNDDDIIREIWLRLDSLYAKNQAPEVNAIMTELFMEMCFYSPVYLYDVELMFDWYDEKYHSNHYAEFKDLFEKWEETGINIEDDNLMF